MCNSRYVTACIPQCVQTTDRKQVLLFKIERNSSEIVSSKLCEMNIHLFSGRTFDR